MTGESPPKLKNSTGLRMAVLAATLLVAVDALWLNQGVIAALVGFVVAFIGLPLALRKKNRPARLQKLRNLGIYATAVALVFVLNTINNHLAAERAEVVVAAVKAFHEKNHYYPQSLNELVPEYLDSIPRAKYTLGQNNFYYRLTDGKAVLFYVKIPPFGRPSYQFSEGKWSYID